MNLPAGAEVTSVADAGNVVVVEVVRPGADGTSSTSRWVVDNGGKAHNPDPLPVAATPGTRDCRQAICYRVAGDALRVDWSLDGGATFAVAWHIDGEDYLYLKRTYPDLGDPAVHLSSRSVVVHRTPSGHVVFVANGRDGLLFRDVEGTWHRLGSPDSGEGCCFYEPVLPLDSRPLDRMGWYVAGSVVLAILGSAGLALRGRRRYGGLVLVVPLAVLAGYGAYLGWSFPPVGMFPGFIYGVPLILVALGAGAWLAVWFVRRVGRPQLEPAAGGPSAGTGRGAAG